MDRRERVRQLENGKILHSDFDRIQRDPSHKNGLFAFVPRIMISQKEKDTSNKCGKNECTDEKQVG